MTSELADLWHRSDRERISDLEGELNLLRDAAQAAVKALTPFADRVYNDNNDFTVSDIHLVKYDDYVRAYRALARLAEQGIHPTESGAKPV